MIKINILSLSVDKLLKLINNNNISNNKDKFTKDNNNEEIKNMM